MSGNKKKILFFIFQSITAYCRAGGGGELRKKNTITKHQYAMSLEIVVEKTTLVVMSHCCDFAFDDSDATVSNRSNNGTFTIITATGSRKS